MSVSWAESVAITPSVTTRTAAITAPVLQATALPITWTHSYPMMERTATVSFQFSKWMHLWSHIINWAPECLPHNFVVLLIVLLKHVQRCYRMGVNMVWQVIYPEWHNLLTSSVKIYCTTLVQKCQTGVASCEMCQNALRDTYFSLLRTTTTTTKKIKNWEINSTAQRNIVILN